MIKDGILQKIGMLQDLGYEEYVGKDVFFSLKNRHVMSAEFIEQHSVEKIKEEIWESMINYKISFLDDKTAKESKDELVMLIMSKRSLI